MSKRSEYYQMVQSMGKKEFTLMKMIEYGFWPKDLPTPFDKQENETKEEYEKRKKLMGKQEKLIHKISELYKTKQEIDTKLQAVQQKFMNLKDLEQIRKELAKQIWEESKIRREERKKLRAEQKRKKTEAWEKKKAKEIVYVGNGYSSFLYHTKTDLKKIKQIGIPSIKTEKDILSVLDLKMNELRFITYHRDVVEVDHYIRFKIPKKKGGERTIAAPKAILKTTQRKILERILSQVEVSEHAHGFLKGKSVISGAKEHSLQPYLVINMDLKNFFPTITFERVRGMFHSFGYSGHISTLLTMICTYCERTPIEVNGRVKHVVTSKRILPQGSPASPMITNIICRKLDKRLHGLATRYGMTYSRYADDMSFSLIEQKDINIGQFWGMVNKIVSEEGFEIHKQKTRFLRKNNQQKITGIIINHTEIGLPKKWIKRYRAAIHNTNRLLEEKQKISESKIYEIAGMTSWVKSVNAERYATLITAAQQLITNAMEEISKK